MTCISAYRMDSTRAVQQPALADTISGGGGRADVVLQKVPRAGGIGHS